MGFIGLPVAVVVTLSGCVASGGQSDLEAAKELCAAESVDVSVLDDGRALSIVGEGEESGGAALDEIVCVLDELEIPDAIWSRIGQTRALDGMQEATWSAIWASWTYHPSSGLSVIVEEQE